MTDLPVILEWIIAAVLVIGAGFALVGSWGLFKLRDFYKRLHGPTKATTLGVGAALVGSTLYFTATTGSFSAREFLIAVFLFITAPVSAHLLIKAVLKAASGRDVPPPPA